MAALVNQFFSYFSPSRMAATAKTDHPTTNHTRMGASQSPIEERCAFDRLWPEAGEAFRRVDDGERRFAFNGAVSGGSMLLLSAVNITSGSAMERTRALHDQNAYDPIKKERRATRSSITVCP